MSARKNISFVYLLPLLMDEALEIKGFVTNTYLKDVNDPSKRRRLYLKVKYDLSQEYLRFEEELTWSLYYKGKYDIDDKYAMITFDIPDVYHKDYDKFIAGKYSELSAVCKDMIIEFNECTDYSYPYGVLFKKEFAFKLVEARINKGLNLQHWTCVPREQEACSIVDINKETFTKKVSVKLEY